VRGGGETRYIQYRSVDYKDRRGGTAKDTPRCPFDSIDTISFNNMMKRE
jgi:hypothetical protein